MSDQQRIARGSSASREWAETEAAFSAVEAAILRTLSETPVGQDAKVLKLHMAVQNLAAVRQAIRAVIDDGLVAQSAVAVAGLTRPN